MDQSVMAGIGNIYRSEILWRQAIHPEIPGREIDKPTFGRIWEDAKLLLEIGVKKNAIVTVKNAPSSRTRYRERVNISCKIHARDVLGSFAALKLVDGEIYVCENCQPRYLNQ